jgi:hypothetical protein
MQYFLANIHQKFLVDEQVLKVIKDVYANTNSSYHKTTHIKKNP